MSGLGGPNHPATNWAARLGDGPPNYILDNRRAVWFNPGVPGVSPGSIGVGRLIDPPRDAWTAAWAAQDAEVARRAFRWLRDNTDTFDPVMVGLALEVGDIKPDDAMIEQWVEAFSSGR